MILYTTRVQAVRRGMAVGLMAFLVCGTNCTGGSGPVSARARVEALPSCEQPLLDTSSWPRFDIKPGEVSLRLPPSRAVPKAATAARFAFSYPGLLIQADTARFMPKSDDAANALGLRRCKAMLGGRLTLLTSYMPSSQSALRVVASVLISDTTFYQVDVSGYTRSQSDTVTAAVWTTRIGADSKP